MTFREDVNRESTDPGVATAAAVAVPRDRGNGDGAAGAAPKPAAPVRLGEELPIFCERCGYSLHGLTQTRCERCTVLHFACPECGHHQPINTLRPAVQRFLGRVRAIGLVLSVLFKLNFFGWLLVAWFGMGVGWSYEYSYHQWTGGVGGRSYSAWAPRQLDLEALLAFGLFALPFGLVSRMLLLRWRRAGGVAAVLAGLVVAAVLLGGAFRGWVDSHDRLPPLSTDFYLLALIAGLTVILGVLVAWPIWYVLVHTFLSRRTATALLDWQRSLSVREAHLGRT